IAPPAWHELWRGCYRLPESYRRSQIELYLREIVRTEMLILSYDEAAAEWHAAERARLERLGNTPPYVDGQIIAVAKIRDLRLVTLNPRDFGAFEGGAGGGLAVMVRWSSVPRQPSSVTLSPTPPPRLRRARRRVPSAP